MTKSIEIKDLTKVFNPKSNNSIKALDKVSFSLDKGIIFGLLGPNGAGKTTLIKILLGIVNPSGGAAKILGSDISDYNIKRKIGYLPENHKFPSYLSGEEVILYSAKLSGKQLNKDSEQIGRILELVKMEKWRKTKIRKYSKGMLQRIGLAQAVIHDPEIVFLDEPTDGVDPVGRKEIRDILIDLKGRGKTIFVNSHLLSEVELVSDQVAILNEGRLVKFGTVDELTVNKQICEIKTETPISDDMKIRLSKQYSVEFSQSLINLEITETGTLNKFMDELRRDGINITGVNQKKTSLEDLFIKSLNEN
jgi:ABC-2 type transport system ATP-binding protein